MAAAVVRAGVAALVVCVEVGVGFGRFMPIDATCPAMGWHASIPARCFSAIITRAGESLLGSAAIPDAIVRPLPDIVFSVVCALDDVFPIFWCGSGALACHAVGLGQCGRLLYRKRSVLG